jgi:hypothetical protein
MRKLFFVGITSIALLAALPLYAVPAKAAVDVGISINIGPPAMPVYEQPPVPAPNYVWEPGYWAWGPGGYYWVPGTWVLAPEPGLMWTPGYWAYDNGAYDWNQGYWAAQVGFYGGVDYGFGYFGVGYVGGGWQGNDFAYNTAVTNVNTTIVRNVYVDRTVVEPAGGNRPSFNGGPGGVQARPTFGELVVAHFDRHDPPTAAQMEHERIASENRSYLASVNHGRPTVAAVARPLTATNHPSNFVVYNPQHHAAETTHHVAPTRTLSAPVRHEVTRQPPMRHQPASVTRHPAPVTRPVETSRPPVVTHPFARPASAPHPMMVPHYQPRPRPQGPVRPQNARPQGGRPQGQPQGKPHPRPTTKPGG